MEKLDYNFTADEFDTICSNITKIHDIARAFYEALEDKTNFYTIMIRGIEGVSLMTLTMLQEHKRKEMNELIKINYDSDRPTILGKDLH